MRNRHATRLPLPAAVLLPALLFVPCEAIADQPDLEGELIGRVVTRLKSDVASLREMTWVETAVLEKRDRDGAVRSRTVEAEEIFFEGDRRLKRPLSTDMSEDSESLAVVRREESRFLQQGRAREVKSSPFHMDNLMRCFRFKSEEDEAGLDGPLHRLRFRPVPNCLEDPSRATRILSNLTGTLWVDRETSEIVRVEGSIEEPVSFGFGILGRVDSFRIRVDREVVAPGVWAIVRTDYRARGRSFIFNRFDVQSTRYRSAFASAAVADADDTLAEEDSDGAALALSGAPSVER